MDSKRDVPGFLAILGKAKDKAPDDGADEMDMPSAKDDAVSCMGDFREALKSGDDEKAYKAFCELLDAHADHEESDDEGEESEDYK